MLLEIYVYDQIRKRQRNIFIPNYYDILSSLWLKIVIEEIRIG